MDDILEIMLVFVVAECAVWAMLVACTTTARYDYHLLEARRRGKGLTGCEICSYFVPDGTYSAKHDGHLRGKCQTYEAIM